MVGETNDVIDFSTSVNPYGPSPLVRRAIQRVQLDQYPDLASTELTEVLSLKHALPSEWIVPGNGATALIHAAARVWGGPDKPIGHIPPTFGEYAKAARLVGAPIVSVTHTDDHIVDPQLHALGLLYLCSPNNPTGELISRDWLTRVLEAHAAKVVVVDEAFIEFVTHASSAIPLTESFQNLLIVRSMTKDYGLTALRLGYAVGHPRITSELRRQLPPWSVNGLAQAAGVAALQDRHYLDLTLGRVRRAGIRLRRALKKQGWHVSAGEANFMLVNVGSGRAVSEALARRGLIVRDCQSFGLPEIIRVGVRRPSENARLLDALADLRR